jgi:hypothetical protein
MSSRNKTAIFVLSDPASESEEAFGRVFNALAAAHDLKSRGDDVQLVFQGAGTRWPEKLADEDHPAHALYRSVNDVIVGASSGCADAFGAREGVEKCNVPLLSDNQIPETSGITSIAGLAAEGFNILTF